MDSLIAAASRALAAGDALGALKRVALRDDPPALALRGIAMAQLGEHPRARELLRRAARGFGAHEEMARARCVVAEAEVALAMRDLGGSPRTLAAAAAALEARADHANALQARLIAARRLAAARPPRRDRCRAARRSMRAACRRRSPPWPSWPRQSWRCARCASAPARAALARAHEAAERARVPALQAEVAEARAAFERPAARHLAAGHEQSLRLDEVAALFASDALVLDACRRGLRAGDTWLPLARRPVLFALARALAEAWPDDVEREALIAQAFRTRHPDETHRARLRVEIGRLRTLVAPLAQHRGHRARFRAPAARRARSVVVLVPPIDGDEASLVALLADGAAWSTSALALALGESQRTVQRALAELEAAGRVRSIGRARAQRWLAPPLAGFTTILLLPAALPLD